MNYLKAINFKKKYQNLISNGDFKILKTNNDKVFAYSIVNENQELIVAGNLDEEESQKAQIKGQFLKYKYLLSQFQGSSHPKLDKETINTSLTPLEIQVWVFDKINQEALPE